MKAQIGEVHGDVNKLEGRLDSMQASFLAEQETANEGILLLCRCVVLHLRQTQNLSEDCGAWGHWLFDMMLPLKSAVPCVAQLGSKACCNCGMPHMTDLQAAGVCCQGCQGSAALPDYSSCMCSINVRWLPMFVETAGPDGLPGCSDLGPARSCTPSRLAQGPDQPHTHQPST